MKVNQSEEESGNLNTRSSEMIVRKAIIDLYLNVKIRSQEEI